MAILYNIQPKANPADRSAAPKYYVVSRAWDHIDQKRLIADMVRNTSLTKQEAATAIDYLFETVPRYLQLGMTVQLGELGYFKCTVHSDGADTPEEAGVHLVRSIHLKFIPGAGIRDEVNKFPLEKWPER